jgi:hypothetical protein
MYPLAITLAAQTSATAKAPAKTAVVHKASAHGAPSKGQLASLLDVNKSNRRPLHWAPGGASPVIIKSQVAIRLAIPKQPVSFVLPRVAALPKGGYHFGKVGFTPLAPMMIVPRNLKPVLPSTFPLQPVSAPPSVPPSAPAVAKAVEDTPSYPLTAISERQPLSGVNRPVSSIIQELATREKLKVIIGPTAEKTLTLRFNDVDPERALQRVVEMAGLARKKYEGVWYIATPEWIARAFPEQHFNQLVQLPTEDAEALANALQKVLGNGTKVEAVGKTNLIVHAPVASLETTAQVLSQWPTEGESKKGLMSSIALDLPDGADESLIQAASFSGKEAITLERTRKRSYVLHGEPMAVLAGLKNYVAEVNRVRLTNTSVARRLGK